MITNPKKTLSFQVNYEIRTTSEGSVQWFCAKDICNILGYSSVRQAVHKNCVEEGVCTKSTATKGGNQRLIYITAANVFRLISHSRKPNTQGLEALIFETSLPFGAIKQMELKSYHDFERYFFPTGLDEYYRKDDTLFSYQHEGVPYIDADAAQLIFSNTFLDTVPAKKRIFVFTSNGKIKVSLCCALTELYDLFKRCHGEVDMKPDRYPDCMLYGSHKNAGILDSLDTAARSYDSYGFVYVLDLGNNVVKVGCSREPIKRAESLGIARRKIVKLWATLNMFDDESDLHKILAGCAIPVNEKSSLPHSLKGSNEVFNVPAKAFIDQDLLLDKGLNIDTFAFKLKLKELSEFDITVAV